MSCLPPADRSPRQHDSSTPATRGTKWRVGPAVRRPGTSRSSAVGERLLERLAWSESRGRPDLATRTDPTHLTEAAGHRDHNTRAWIC